MCRYFEEHPSPEIVMEMMPKIRRFYTLGSSRLTTKLLRAKMRDGRPAFNFMDLRRFSTYQGNLEDEQNIRYLLQKANLLEKLELSVGRGKNLVGLLSQNARTLKVLHLSGGGSHFLGGICEVLEALVGDNVLEAFQFDVGIDSDGTMSKDFVGSIFQKVENVLLKPVWSVLRRVSFKLWISGWNQDYATKLFEPLQSLPNKYLSHLSNLESVTFKYQVYMQKCAKSP